MWALVLHACPAVVPFAAAQSVCESHPQVSDDASHTAPSAVLHTAHVTDPPHAPGRVPATHAPPVQQKPPVQVPSLPAPQADVHAPAAHVGVPAPQGVQVAPVAHAPFAVPGAQSPALQHPPLHAVWLVPSQPLPHVCVLVLQASPAFVPLAAAQSVWASHPQVSVADSHFVPPALPTQLAHVPDPPHASGCVPATQAPAEQQNPALQAPSPVTPHPDVHTPPAQVGVPAPQVAHARPVAPHWPFPVPATHAPRLSQHPPLQGWVASHAPAQTCVAPHASPAGQSVEVLQPQDVPFSHT